jgi:predicted transcriptional regulator
VVLGLVKYRRRFEIVADILSVAEKGAKKTWIMYFANLSYKLLERYLEETMKIGLIQLKDDRFQLTEKGQLFLGAYSQFSSRYSRIEKDLESLRCEMKNLEQMCTTEKEGEDKRGGRTKINETLLQEPSLVDVS